MRSVVHSLFFMLILSTATAKYVSIQNMDGREIEVELLELNGNDIEFKMRSGQKYEVALDTLSPSSRKLIKKWHEEASKVVLTPDDRIKASIITKRDSDDVDGGYQGWKDMEERIEPGVLIRNDEYKRAFSGLKATLVLIGEDVTNRKNLKVLFKDSFTFDIKERSNYRWEGKPFTIDYLIDDNDSYDNSYGHKYKYYFIVIRNPDGSLGHAAASTSAWARDPRLIDKLKVNEEYTRDLR